MVTRKQNSGQKKALKKLGRRIEVIILKDLGYSSLDAFSIEHSDLVTKPTLYQVVYGERDMKFSTIWGLSEALEIKLETLLKDLN